MSDTSGQDGNQGGGPSGGNNGVFSNPTFQKLLQTTIGLVAQMHGGQAQAAGVPGAGPMQSNIQPGSFQSPGNAMLSGNTGTPPQGGSAPPLGSQSAPPATSGGRPPIGAPQTGYGGWGQPAAPPMQQGRGTQGSVTNIQPTQNFSQAPWMAGPLNDYAAFSKANPVPKPPTYEDAIDRAEKIRQNTVGGSMQPGAGGGIGTNPALVDQVMKGMNEQYREQLKAHTEAWTGQIQAGHTHNQNLAQQEKERHDRAAEKNAAAAVAGRGQTAAANQADKDRKFGSLSAAQQARLDQHKDDQAALAERYNRAQTDKEREQVLVDARKNTEDFYRSIATKSYAGAAAGDSKATQAASDEAQKGPPAAASPGEGQPVPVKTPEDVKRMNLQSGTKIQLPDGRIGTVP